MKPSPDCNEDGFDHEWALAQDGWVHCMWCDAEVPADDYGLDDEDDDGAGPT